MCCNCPLFGGLNHGIVRLHRYIEALHRDVAALH